MTTKHIQKEYRSFPSRKEHPDEPSPDLSLYSAKGYVSWLAKLKKADKRKAQLVMRGTSEGRILDLSPGVVGRVRKTLIIEYSNKPNSA